MAVIHKIVQNNESEMHKMVKDSYSIQSLQLGEYNECRQKDDIVKLLTSASALLDEDYLEWQKVRWWLNMVIDEAKKL